jgi:hypothetical protein
MTRAVVGWAACEQSRSCLARASWQKGKVRVGVVVGSFGLNHSRVDDLGYALQARSGWHEAGW